MATGDARVALITGASSGIGRATALAFAREGYRTVLADVDEAQGRESASGCEQEGVASRFVQCDVSDESSVQNLIAEAVSSFGRIDAAFNNAGTLGDLAPTADYPTASFDRVIAVNLRGVWLCLREELRQMVGQESGAAIVNCSSIAGLVGLAGVPAYVASKHGVIGLTRSAALEYAKQKIRVNAVCPGPIDTPMLDQLMSGMPGGRDSVLALEPVGRIASPEEIAAAVVWLCSPAASFVTGHAMAVDGGWTVG
jgi:NAD(P)-dependent dehydrogenase (short-subunit alcohol dehydrogenase family)